MAVASVLVIVVAVPPDVTASVVAAGLGGERLVILTEVPGVYRDFGKDGGAGEPIAELRPGADAALVGDLPAGWLVARIGGLSADDTLDRVSAMAREGLVAEVPGAPARFRFAHPLIRETVYDGLGPARRMRLHRATADALEAGYASSPDHFAELALHFYLAARGGADAEKAVERLDDVMTVLPEALGVSPDGVFLKRRKRRKRTEQYSKLAATGEFYQVHEGDCSFLLNFTDYLDTGLFLDHRLTRELVRRESPGRRFLNLFAYTCTATVYAAKGGAASTTSIDSSNTYLRWARENLTANGIAGQQHRLLRADCWEWLHVDQERYDLIFMDPPTFSNAKGKRATLDVQRDHPKLIKLAAARLAPHGTLLFSTNFRRFQLDRGSLSGFDVEDITRETIPRDFARNSRIHRCFRIGVGGDSPRPPETRSPEPEG